MSNKEEKGLSRKEIKNQSKIVLQYLKDNNLHDIVAERTKTEGVSSCTNIFSLLRFLGEYDSIHHFLTYAIYLSRDDFGFWNKHNNILKVKILDYKEK